MSNRRDGGRVPPSSAGSAGESARGKRPSSDELCALMARYAKGEITAFERLFALLSPRIYGFHLRSLGSPALAEDLTQLTFLKLHVARRRYRVGAPLEPWVFAIAKNVQRDRLRRQMRTREMLTDDGELPQDAKTASEPAVGDILERERLSRAIQQLPEGQRDVIVLHKFEGLSMKEVAATLDIGLSAAKVRAFRGYGGLRKILERDDG